MIKNKIQLINWKCRNIHGGLAQLVERLLCKQNVIGSTPVSSTIFNLIKNKGPVAQLVRAHAW